MEGLPWKGRSVSGAANSPCSHWDLSPVSCTGEAEPWQGGEKRKQGSIKSEAVAEKRSTLDSSAQMVLQHIRFPPRVCSPPQLWHSLWQWPSLLRAWGGARGTSSGQLARAGHCQGDSFVQLKESAAFRGGNWPYSEFCQIVLCLCPCSSACLCGHAAVSPCRQDSFCLCLSLAALSPLSFGLGVSVQQRGSDCAGI